MGSRYAICKYEEFCSREFVKYICVGTYLVLALAALGTTAIATPAKLLLARQDTESKTFFDWAERCDLRGNLEAALASCDRALELDEGVAQLWTNRGAILTRLYRYAEALVSFERALDLIDNYSLAWFNRGNVLYHLSHYEEAIASYDRALEADARWGASTPANAWYNRGTSFHRMERFEEAIASYDRAVRLDPELVGAWANRGASLVRLERYEEALASYDRALEIDPDFVPARKNREWLVDLLGESASESLFPGSAP